VPSTLTCRAPELRGAHAKPSVEARASRPAPRLRRIGRSVRSVDPAVRNPIRGRDRELSALAMCADDVLRGVGVVVVVAGLPGSGKSRVLDSLVDLCRAKGFAIVASSANTDATGPRPTLDGTGSSACESARSGVHDLPDQIATILDRAAPGAALLVCIDDADRMDAAGARVVASLVSELDGRPILWALAGRSDVTSPAFGDLFHELRRRDASTVSLGPLEPPAVDEIIVDMLHADPSEELRQLAALADGEPRMLIELVRAALDEGRVSVDAGRAELVMPGVPERVGGLARAALSELSPPARQAALVGSIIGDFVSYDHLASMLEVPATALLGTIDELENAHLLVDVAGTMRFSNRMLRRAVTENVPRAARQPLRRQAIDVLLAAGQSPLELARDFAANAATGDRAAIATLTAAMRRLADSHPTTALQIGSRALDLSTVDDDGRFALAADVAALLGTTGHAEDGSRTARTFLEESSAPASRAKLSLSIAEMTQLPHSVRVEAGRHALALPAVPADLRARHLGATVVNLLEDGRIVEATEMLHELEQVAVDGQDPHVSGALRHARALLAAATGAVQEARNHLAAPPYDGQRRARTNSAKVMEADLLMALDQFDDAHRVATDALRDAQVHGRVADEQSWQRFFGRYFLQVGRVAEAASALDTTTAENAPVASFTVEEAVTMVALSRIAIRAGDARLVHVIEARADQGLTAATAEARRHLTWLLAMTSLAIGERDHARSRLAELGADASPTVLPLQMLSVMDHAMVVRTALHAGRPDLATLAVAAANQRAHQNPGAAAIGAAAAHSHGLLERDADALAEAAELLAPTPRRLARAFALEDHGALLAAQARSGEALASLNTALDLYAFVGASWDAARVRRRLRLAGVRRRLTAPGPPADGWAGLTRAELAVVRLVADGLSNRAAADQLYLSPHTVSMHLRHVYTKLAITSRVELARIVARHEAQR
jgi:DNA-binding CsgD family transcriptional regulator